MIGSPSAPTGSGARDPRTPVVSIGVPVYNGERFLAELLSSLLNQTFTDFELIISDNASTDATEAICRDHARLDPRIRYSRSPVNRGAIWNHHRVVELARGEFFKWAAHDDACAPAFLERCVAAFRTESPDVVLVYPRSTVVDEHGAFLWEHSDRLDLRERAPHQRLQTLIWNPPTVGTAHYGLVRTTALRQGRGLQGFVSSDYVFLAELAMMGEFREVPECLLIKRYHPGMSREINSSIADLAEWTQPGSSQHLILEYWNLFAQHLVAISKSRLGFLDRARCYAVFVPNWFGVWRSQLVKELRGLPAEFRRVRARRRATAASASLPTRG